jgi:anaplastic lymphoma kinase
MTIIVNLANTNTVSLIKYKYFINFKIVGPAADPENNANGHFLHLRLTPNTTQRVLRSPHFSSTLENCILEVYTHQSSMKNSSIRIVIEPSSSNEKSWVPAEIAGNDLNKWILHKFRLDRVSKEFQILFEVVPNNLNTLRAHVSIDNLKLKNCFPESAKSDKCTVHQTLCTSNKVTVCIPPSRICDLIVDCDENEDELVNCGKFLITLN